MLHSLKQWIHFQVVCLFSFHWFGLLCFWFVPSFVQYFSAFTLFFFFLSYHVRGLLFLGFKKSWIISLKKFEFFLPLGFCPPKVGPVVCMSLVFREICAEYLLVCFVFPLMDKAEWGGNPVCWWLGLYFCFVCCLTHLHRMLLVVGWCWVLYSSGLICVSSYYLILPRVSSLVV